MRLMMLSGNGPTLDPAPEKDELGWAGRSLGPISVESKSTREHPSSPSPRALDHIPQASRRYPWQTQQSQATPSFSVRSSLLPLSSARVAPHSALADPAPSARELIFLPSSLTVFGALGDLAKKAVRSE